MSKFLKTQKGFTLIEILVVVIIVAILAAIAVPIYMRYVEQARATEPQSAIRSIRNAYNIQKQKYGNTDDYTVEEAMEDCQLGESTTKNWEFEVIGSPPKKFVATSTADHPAGEGHQVTYDTDEAYFYGWGVDEYSDENED